MGENQKNFSMKAFAVVGWVLFLGTAAYGYYVYGPQQYRNGYIVNENPSSESIDSIPVQRTNTVSRTATGTIRSIQNDVIEVETTIFIGSDFHSFITVQVKPETNVFRVSFERVAGDVAVQEQPINVTELTVGDDVDFVFEETGVQPFPLVKISAR